MVGSNSHDIYILWAIFGPIIFIIGWLITRDVSSIHVKLLIRSFIAATTCGFIGIGTHSSGITLPAWSLLTPQANFVGVRLIIGWWIMILMVSYVFYFIVLKVSR